MADQKVTNSLKRNPAATTTGTVGVLVLAAIQAFNVTLTPEQTNLLLAVMAALPGFINWLKGKWSWLQKLVASGTPEP